MLSIANITAKHSSAYYEKDDYYAMEELAGGNRAYSKWYGQLAKELGLKGAVSLKDFDNLLKGKISKYGSKKVIAELGRINKDGKKEHAAGIDLTFSAPKSLSILALVGGDIRLIDAHEKAVAKTLRFIEKELVRTKIRKGASSSKDTTIDYKHTGKAVIATYNHNLSRNHDPQIHTHCVFLNITKTEDGKFRSGEFYLTFKNKKLLGQIYRNELSRELEALGYTIEKIHEDGRFEIKEIPKEPRRDFSSRRVEIEGIIEHSNLQTEEHANDIETKKALSKTAQRATLTTRGKKTKVSKDVLFTKWNKIIDKHNLNLNTIIDNSKQKAKDILLTNKLKPKSLKQITSEAVSFAISHLSERHSIFNKTRLIGEALKFNNKTSLEYILSELSLRQEKGEIILQDSKIIPSDTILMEKENIKLLKSSKQTTNPILKEDDLIPLNRTVLNTGQKQSVSLILTSKDRIVAVQGSAGTGKTFMLNEARKLIEKQGYEFIGMAPSASATKVLKDDANLKEASTLQKFLRQYEGLTKSRETKQGLEQMKAQYQNKIIIVDEASMISTKQMNSLLKITNKLNCKLVLIGDTKQLSSVEAGKPFADLQKSGMQTAKMTEIIRQRDLELKETVKSIINSKIKEAFKSLGNNIIEKHSVETLPERTVEEYFKHSKEERETILLLTPSNALRKEINSLVRETLKNNNELSMTETIIQNTLEPKNLSSAERGESFNYSKGDVVTFNKGYKVRNIMKGESFEVREIKDNSLILERTGVESERNKIDVMKNKNLEYSINQNNISKANGNISDISKEYLKGQEAKEKDSVSNQSNTNQSEQNLIEFTLKGKSSPSLEVFTNQTKELSAGDKIRWLRNNKENKIINSHTSEIKSINKEAQTITLEEKQDNNKTKTITLNLSSPILKHIDYAYASTAYASQGKTTKKVIAVLESNKPLTNQQSFYVEISRAKDNAVLIVDNKQEVLNTLEKNTGIKISALEQMNVEDINKLRIRRNRFMRENTGTREGGEEQFKERVDRDKNRFRSYDVY